MRRLGREGVNPSPTTYTVGAGFIPARLRLGTNKTGAHRAPVLALSGFRDQSVEAICSST